MDGEGCLISLERRGRKGGGPAMKLGMCDGPERILWRARNMMVVALERPTLWRLEVGVHDVSVQVERDTRERWWDGVK